MSPEKKYSASFPIAVLGTYSYVDVPAVYDILNAHIFGDSIAVVTIIFLVCAAVCWILLSKLRWGRFMYAIGANEEAARLSGR